MIVQDTLIGKILKPTKYYKNLESFAGSDGLAIVDVVQGCFFMIRRDVFDSIGLFDENTFLYYEEMILAQKLNRKGYSNAVLVEECIYHNHKSKDYELKRIEKKFFDLDCYLASRLYYLDRYLETDELFKCLVSRYLKLDCIIKKVIIKLLSLVKTSYWRFFK